jgi:hypothetical protein
VDGDGEDRGDGRGGEGGNEACIGDKRLCARHLARVRQLRRVEKAPLNRARHPMHAAKAGPDAGLRGGRRELDRHLVEELVALALLDRRGQC